MVLVAKLVSFAAIIYLTYVFVYSFFKPISRKRKKRTRVFIKNARDRRKQERLLYYKDVFIRGASGRLLLSEAKKEELERIIKRLDLKTTPEEIRLKQILYVAGAAAVSYLLLKLNPVLGFISMMFIVIGWIYPVDELEKKVELKNKNILLDFPSFYGMLYYQYSKSVNIYLADVIRDFLPNANADMAEELGNMLDNIEFGEEYALKQLKKRVPVRHIIKFCDIMETRLKGYDNISQMAYLKNELDELRVTALEDELRLRQAKNFRTQFVLIIILAAYIVIYYYFQSIEAIRLFS
ncbi:hypothetical protein DFR58_10514 [Anaerobacterium chartisolvens]|uniref:Flp pilus assembly protein TadB n=1 Tax=Anaerobacterium chartisolvens TaxID=1297424 RepID=A0A369BCF6_9FIRM|nr:hypothetical protein [Anaerobacterium chartisolvens]RCX18256.1 hypothetical protein DFR58_10514 [Anaerobacterium chartisolvens]